MTESACSTPSKSVAMRGSSLPKKSIRAIDMQPDLAPACDGDHLSDRIDSAGVGRARVGDKRDRNEFRGRVAIKRRFERSQIDPHLRVDWNLRDIAAADTEDASRAENAMMDLAAGIEPPAVHVGHSILCWVDAELFERMLSRRAQRHQVCHRPTAHNNPWDC